jgi:GMP reductase
MRIENDVKLDFSDVLIRPKRSTLTSRKNVDLERTLTFPHAQSSWTGIPIIAANMDGVGTLSMMKALAPRKMLVALHKHYADEEYLGIDEEHAFVTIGIKERDEERLIRIIAKKTPHLICIDVANGYTERFVSFVEKVRKLAPESILMAGNVVTGDMTEQLILSGADIVKVGIGPGSACTTRAKTGVGYPQLSAIIECADAAHGLGGYVCADGGCTNPGDIAKAYGAGADFVMLGGMLAAHTESELEIIQQDGEKFIEYYGSSSKRAMEKHSGGVANYRAAEGKEVLLPYRGAVADTVEEILGGLRSACTYVGARRLKELPKRTTFIRVHNQLNTVFGEERKKYYNSKQ